MTPGRARRIRSVDGLTACCLLTIVAVMAACQSCANAPAQPVDEVDAMKEPQLRFIRSNGIRMRIAEMGEGPSS